MMMCRRTLLLTLLLLLFSALAANLYASHYDGAVSLLTLETRSSDDTGDC